MDDAAFDALARRLSAAAPRRSALRALAAAGLALLGAEQGEAAPRRRPNRPNRPGNRPNRPTPPRTTRDPLPPPPLPPEPCADERLVPCGRFQECVDLLTDRRHCGECGNACPRDPGGSASRDLACVGGTCTCTGTVCENGRCCPAGFSVCKEGGAACCPDGFPVGCPNSATCCPAGYRCGGRCGQPCCR